MELIRIAMRKDLENDKSLMSKWAKIAGLKNPNPLYDFLNHDGKTFSEFSAIVNIVKSQYPEREYEFMSDYCLKLDVKTKAARSALEYADSNNYHIITDNLIEKMINCSNNKSKEYGQVYSIHRKLSKSEIGTIEASKAFGKFKFKTEEMNTFEKIAMLYSHLNNGDFAPMFSLMEKIDLTDMNENQFIKSSYTTRLYVLKANIFLFENDLEQCRKNAKLAIDNTNVLRFKVFSYLTLGNSYVFEDYSKSRDCYVKGLNIAKENSFFAEFFKKNLSFVCNVWNKENDWLNKDSSNIEDMQALAHYYINKQKIDEATDLLNSLKTKKQNENELGFYYYLMGLHEDNIDYFFDSVEFYKKSHDRFLIKLPLIALENRGVSKRILDIMAMC